MNTFAIRIFQWKLYFFCQEKFYFDTNGTHKAKVALHCNMHKSPTFVETKNLDRMLIPCSPTVINCHKGTTVSFRHFPLLHSNKRAPQQFHKPSTTTFQAKTYSSEFVRARLPLNKTCLPATCLATRYFNLSSGPGNIQIKERMLRRERTYEGFTSSPSSVRQDMHIS